jgi:uncharacterized protein (DUF362 family)
MSDQEKSQHGAFDRRALLVGGGAAAAGFLAYPKIKDVARGVSPVFVAKSQTYDGPLEQTIADGLSAAGIDPAAYKGRRVLLKPNLVEPMRGSPQMTTHPAMVAATAAVFRRGGAEVVVGEAPGHVRDTEMALIESRLADVILQERLPFADLNYQETRYIRNACGLSKLPGFHFPQAVAEADLIVSMPKMKTHHWMGVTLSMKNLYGTLPGVKYGWPKNVLHYNGIPQTVVDINATLPTTIAVIDGIECMEGDGPILGTPKQMGLVAVGADRLAVDATCARIMGFEPSRVPYLALAHEAGLGQLHPVFITQRGERWQPLVSPFRILDDSRYNQYLRSLQTQEAAIATS